MSNKQDGHAIFKHLQIQAHLKEKEKKAYRCSGLMLIPVIACLVVEIIFNADSLPLQWDHLCLCKEKVLKIKIMNLIYFFWF